MLIREISKILGSYLFFFALALCIPLGISAYYEFIVDPALHPQNHCTFAFIYTFAVCVGIAAILLLIGRKSTGVFYRREGLTVVVLIWFISAVIGGLPFYFSHTLEKPIDAYFEGMSALTTTGSSVLVGKQYDNLTGEEVPILEVVSEHPPISYHYYGTITPIRNPKTGEVVLFGIEAVSKGLLFWRSFMQWLGGMGIVVLFVAILPAFGVGGKVLVQTEMPGPTKESVTPRIKDAASILWKLYLFFTIIEIILLMVTNKEMKLFDATTITFSNLSTGGFCVRNASIESYNNLWTEIIVIVFMILASINFTLYFYGLRGKFYRVLEPEFVTYIVVLIVGCSLVIWDLLGRENLLLTGEKEEFTFANAIRYGTFQYISAQTSTGFTSANYNLWPYLSQSIIFTAMFLGGMSGSTAGGIKIVRHYILFRLAVHKIESIFRPDAIRSFRIANREVDYKIAGTIWSFFLYHHLIISSKHIIIYF